MCRQAIKVASYGSGYDVYRASVENDYTMLCVLVVYENTTGTLYHKVHGGFVINE